MTNNEERLLEAKEIMLNYRQGLLSQHQTLVALDYLRLINHYYLDRKGIIHKKPVLA